MPVTHRRFAGQLHGFLSIGRLCVGTDGLAFIANAVARALDRAGAPPPPALEPYDGRRPPARPTEDR